MIVTFHYQDSPDVIRIYEEFTFNSEGEIVFIEAWDYPLDDAQNAYKLLPKAAMPRGKVPADVVVWPDQAKVYRLSTLIPGLGSNSGQPNVENPKSAGMKSAFKLEKAVCKSKGSKPRLADFVAAYNKSFAVQYAQEYIKVLRDPVRRKYYKSFDVTKVPQHILQAGDMRQTLLNEFILLGAALEDDVKAALRLVDKEIVW
jgi:hypothetical protein